MNKHVQEAIADAFANEAALVVVAKSLQDRGVSISDAVEMFQSTYARVAAERRAQRYHRKEKR